MIALEAAHQIVGADASRDREHADVVGDPALARGDEVRQRAIRPAVGDRLLLPQHRQPRELRAQRVVLVDDDVVAVARGRPEAVDAAFAVSSFSSTIRFKQRLRVVVELTRRGAVLRVLQDRRDSDP